MKPDAPSLWWSASALCASAGYMRCSGRTSVHLFASSPQNLAVPQDLSSQCPCGTILLTLYSIMRGLAGFKSRANDYLLPWLALSPFVFYYLFLSLLSVYRLVLWSWGLWNDMFISLSPSLALWTYFNNNNNLKSYHAKITYDAKYERKNGFGQSIYSQIPGIGIFYNFVASC